MARVSEGCATLQRSAALVKLKLFAERKEIADLMHFHGRPQSSARKRR